MNIERSPRQRIIASSIMTEVISAVERGIPADQRLREIYREHPEFGSRDRRHYSHVIYAYFRWQGLIRRVAASEIKEQCAWAVALDPATTPDIASIWHAATAVTTDRIESARAGFPPDELMPSWLPEVMPDQARRHAFITACSQRPPTWLALEPARVTDFCRLLHSLGIAHTPDARIRGAVAVIDRFDLRVLEKKWGTAIQVQDIASQAVATICRAQAGESWWDACCGGGGKSLSLARAVGEYGTVTATDVRTSMLDNLRTRAAQHGFRQITARALNAEQHAPDRYFDGVLVDAPCSGIGTWTRNPDARWRTTLDDVKKSASRQTAILAMASTRVKPGGKLVYSVCTMSRHEGEDVIQQFLERHPSFDPDNIPHPLTGDTTRGMIQLQPQEGPGDGMFVATMTRRDD